MKPPMVLSVMVAVTLLGGSIFVPTHAQPPSNPDTPTFYHLVPGTYVNGWPRFTVHYPKEWIEEHPAPQEVFRAGVSPERGGEMVFLGVFSDPWPLDVQAFAYQSFFKKLDPNATIVSDRPSQMRDGTPAREFETQFVAPGGPPFTTISLATKKGDLLVRLSFAWPNKEKRDDLKAILYSLEFQPGFDDPVKVPADIQDFIDGYCSDVVSHDVAKVMSHYSDRYLSSGRKKGEAELFWRQVIGPVTSMKIVITDFVPAGDRAYLTGFTDIKPFGKGPLRETSIIKENGEWKWYGNQRDAVAW